MAKCFSKSALPQFVSNAARMERSGIRDSCHSYHTPSWIALPFSRLPTYLLFSTYAISVIVLAAVILLLILDGIRLDILIQWWAEQLSLLTRVSCLPGTLVGVEKTFDYEAH